MRLRQALLALVPLTACSCGSGDFIAADDFTYSDESWELLSPFGLPTMSLVESDVTGTPPYLCGTDTGFSGGERWKFRAPGKYLGDASAAFGRRLTWRAMTQFNSGRLYAENDVLLSGRGITLIAEVPDTPRGSRQWAPFSVFLDVRTPWRRQETGFPLATDDDLRTVLRALSDLQLPGEWRDGDELSCIDEVYFGTP